MAETIGGDIGTQILNAVQGLGVRMDRFEARMDKLEARMGKLEARMDGLEARMDGLETKVTNLDSRMTRQEKLMEVLGAEFIKWREGLRADVQHLRGDVQRLDGDVHRLSGEVQSLREDFRQLRTEMHEGVRRLNARDELTAGAVVMMASVLRRPTDLGENLEKRLQELPTH